MKEQDKRFQIFLWVFTSILGFLAFLEFYKLNILAYVGFQSIWGSKRFLAFIIISFFYTLGSFYILMCILKEKKILSFEPPKNINNWLKFSIALFFLLIPGLIKWILPLPANFNFGYWMEIFLISLLAILINHIFFQNKDFSISLIRVGSLILVGGVVHAILYRLSQVTNYPFTLFWSEGNRFFDYSALFGSYRYILTTSEKIKVFITWGMQLPWALPFIFPALSIGFFRFWYQLMWILPTLILGFVAANQIKSGKSSFLLSVIFAFWTFLFLDQGPIYAPLVICAILTIIAVRSKLFPGIIIILIISYYAHNSRWTWSYAPGLWSGLLALLFIEKPSFTKEGLKKLIKPLLLGTAGYIGGQLVPSFMKSINSSKDLAFFPNPAVSTSHQPLLWTRLFPNPTYPLGILWALAWAVFPICLFLAILILQKKWGTNWLQNLAILIIPGAFLIVGIIASVKIGGGSNLHNLDMFLVSLVLITSSALYFYIQKNGFSLNFSPFTSIILFISLISPVSTTLIGGERLALPEESKINAALTTVQMKIQQYSQKGEILFLDHRQLLTFHLVENVPLIDLYEKKVLMDQALANNNEYFKNFYKDLVARRFALIVNEPLNSVIRGSEDSFGEENDAYVKWVTDPLLCTYEPLYTSRDTSVELLIPRITPLPASFNCDTFFASVK